MKIRATDVGAGAMPRAMAAAGARVVAGTRAWTATWTAGPDAGGEVVLGHGSHVVGRARRCPVRCDDPDLARFHAVIHLGEGEPEVCQVAGGLPVTLARLDAVDEPDRRPGGASATAGVWEVVIGASALRLRPGPAEHPVRRHEAGGPVHRPRRVMHGLEIPPVVPELPSPPLPTRASSGSLAASSTALAGSLVAGIALGQPALIVLGLAGAVTALLAAGVRRAWRARSARRHRRQVTERGAAFARALATQRAAWRAARWAETPTMCSARMVVDHGSEALWQRRPADGDAFVVSAGIGTVPWTPVLAPAPGGGSGQGGERGSEGEWPDALLSVDDVPVPIDAGPGARIAVSGPYAHHVGRAVLLQLAAQCGPADWQLVVVTGDPDRWRWLHGLPHLVTAAGSPAIGSAADLERHLAALDDEQGDAGVNADLGLRRHLLIVSDLPGSLAAPEGPIRRRLASGAAALLAIVDARGAVPALCTGVLTTTCNGRATWDGPPTRSQPTAGAVALRLAGCGESAAGELVRRLARWRDPEVPLDRVGRIPGRVSFTEVVAEEIGTPGGAGIDAATLAERWGAEPPDVRPRVALGRSAHGTVVVDLVRDGPHALVAGTTGSGKSELLRTFVTGMSALASPRQVSFVLVDYKGGAAFDPCLGLPHVTAVVTDLDDALAARAMRSLRAEIVRREEVLREGRATDLAELRRTRGEPVMPRLVIVVDEFAVLAAEQPDFLGGLVDIARRGRSLGIHLVLATQRPAGVITDEIRANTNLRIALRTHDAADANDVVRSALPASFSRDTPGRAVLRVGPDELVAFQVADSGTEPDLPETVAVIDRAAELAGCAPVAGPWLPELPSVLPADGVEAGAVGLVDLPERRAREPLVWTPAAGSLVIVGSAGSGVSTTLRSIVAVAGSAGAEIYVLDATGDPGWDPFELAAGVAGVFRVDERERVFRLLDHLARRPAAPPAVLVVDGSGALAALLATPERAKEHADMARIVEDGRVTLVVGAPALSAIPGSMLRRCAHRWLMHVNDPYDAVALGLPAGIVPPAIPGRLVIGGGSAGGAAGASAAQVAVVHPRLDPTPRDAELDVLPARVCSSALAPGSADPVTVVFDLPIGVGFLPLTPLSITIGEGDHVTVIGRARSGRSSALLTLGERWREAAPGGVIAVVTPRRSPLRGHDWGDAVVGYEQLLAIDDGRPRLLVVDDCELVDDPDGTLAALAARPVPGLTILCAGRPDAMRQAYGHWSSVVRRSRLGLVMAGGAEGDGDLLGIALPRRLPIDARPGLAHLVADGEARLLQVALPAVPTMDAAAAS